MTKDTVDGLLKAMLESAEGVSDLLFVPGRPPLVESHGRLLDLPIDTPDSTLSAQMVDQVADVVMNGTPRLLADLEAVGSCDCSYAVPDVARFRVNIFKQNGQRSIVMRKLATTVPQLDALGLPPIFREMVREKTGVILVTGGTGSGKTTTLAAMINEMNHTQEVHIVTLEDPIEFFYSKQKAVVSQRELGKDFRSFADGLRAALRQAPKAILVGEIRDRESLDIALTASETGHLVFSTMHTISAGQTVNRIVGMHASEEEQQARQRLSETLRYVVSQRLIPKVGGGRLLVTEVMGSSMRTRETIVYGESENKTYNEIIEAGSTMGWHSFDQSLVKAYAEGLITEETALTYCSIKPRMRRDLDNLKKANGTSTEEINSGLKMSAPEPPPVPVMRPRPVAPAPPVMQGAE
ncbi:MAG: type IV pilus twitching motility protein PilT [Chthoniobacterales bacterium]